MKTACLRGLEEGGFAFDRLGTHTCDRHLARYAVGLQQTDLNTAGLFWTGQYAREQVGVRRLAILIAYAVNILVTTTNYNYNNTSHFYKIAD